MADQNPPKYRQSTRSHVKALIVICAVNQPDARDPAPGTDVSQGDQHELFGRDPTLSDPPFRSLVAANLIPVLREVTNEGLETLGLTDSR